MATDVICFRCWGGASVRKPRCGLPFLDRFVTSLCQVEVGGDERLLVLGLHFGVFEEGLEVTAGLVTALAVTRFAEVLELLVTAVPAVAVLVVLAGLRAGDRLATGDTGDFPAPTPIRGAPHTTRFGPVVLRDYRTPPREIFHSPVPQSFRRRDDRPRSGRFIRRRGLSPDMNVKSRHHLRADAIDEIEDALAANLGVEIDADAYERVEFDDSDWDVVLVDGDPFVLYVHDEDGTDSEPFLTVQGANAHPPDRHVVTVDAGAVSFVSDGADVMRPGIVEADGDIEAGDLVAISEESHGKFLAIGRARTSGDDMVGDSGKVVDSIHHVGDDLFEFSI